MTPRDKLAFLKQELARWVEQGLVSSDQQERILALYPDPSAPAAPVEKRRVAAWLPAILITMAVLLIGVGLSLFYAANWRKMPPVLKLAQIVGVLVSIHGGAYALLFGRRPMPIAGRGLLLLGMLTFGAAIGLVAQTYHISAHPTNGVLLWLVGVIALSAVMRDRIGCYLAALLALVWHLWEFGAYDNFNPQFLVVAGVLGGLFYRLRDRAGVLVVALQAVLWLYLANARLLDRVPDSGAALLVFLFQQIPLGVGLIAFERLRKPDLLDLTGTVLGALGWLCIFTPLIGLSWPMSVGDSARPFFARGMMPLLVEHVVLSAIAGALLIRVRRQGGTLLSALALLFGLAAVVLPLQNQSVLLVFTHLGLVGFILGLLLDSHRTVEGRALQRIIAFFCAVSSLLVKAIVFLVMAEMHQSFLLAYVLGAVVFALVIFLCNGTAAVVLARTPDAARYRGKLLDGLCTLVVFLLLYAASFKLAPQSSLLDADRVVIVLLAVFVALGAALYAFLWRRGADRLPLALSAVVFVGSLVLLLGAGPAWPWHLYAVAVNLLLLVLQGLLLVQATRKNSIALANLVMLAFALQVVTRYFDIFWDLLSGSLLFIVTGVVVFVGGFLLERNRRRLVRHIREARP